MRKIGLYLLILIVLGNNSILGELAKVPFLISHYLSHQQQNTGITMQKFMDMHYFGQDMQDDDDQQDMKLPFKKMAHYAHTMICTAQKVFDEDLRPVYFRERKSLCHIDFEQGLYNSQVDRPPQAAIA